MADADSKVWAYGRINVSTSNRGKCHGCWSLNVTCRTPTEHSAGIIIDASSFTFLWTEYLCYRNSGSDHSLSSQCTSNSFTLAIRVVAIVIKLSTRYILVEGASISTRFRTYCRVFVDRPPQLALSVGDTSVTDLVCTSKLRAGLLPPS